MVDAQSKTLLPTRKPFSLLLSNFTGVFDSNRYSAFDDFDIEIGHMNYDVSDWDVSNAVVMDRMFRATTFNRNLAKWNVTSVTSM